MSEISFHNTPMGRTFYDVTMPAIVRELARLNDNLERIMRYVEGIPGKQDGTLPSSRY